MDFVSVILPYYQKINYVKSAIESVMRQSHKNFELIIVYDDNDKSDLFKINKIIKKNKKVRLIINKKNLGAGISRNIGIKNSKGKYIAFIDADDTWNKKKLEKQILFIKKNNYSFIFCNYTKRKYGKEKKIICNEKFLDYKKLLKSCDIGLSTVMIKSSILKKNLFPTLKTKEDYVLWLKITKKNIRAYNLSETLVVWNSVKNSLSSNIIQKIKDGFLVYKKYQGFNILKSIYYLLLLSLNSLKKI